MTKIKAFKAFRPVRDKVHLVATRPYYSYKKNVLKAKLEDNPFTFLHIINPEFGSKIKTKPNSKERFELVSEKYHEFIEDGILFQDTEEHLYIYRQTKNGHAYTGVIGGASVLEYEQDKIKKHEATLTSREKMFTDYLDIVGYNAEPVLLSYASNKTIEDLIEKISAVRPEYEFTTTDRIKHELWIVSLDDTQELTKAFESINAVYIADGHHRSASSAGLKNKRVKEDRSGYANEDYFLAYFIDEKRLKILEFNRLIKNIGSITREELLDRLSVNFTLAPLSAARKPEHEHQFTMCLQGDWYVLNCKSSIIEEDHPVHSLDADILTQHVLAPILNIKDLKTDENIEFISGAESLTSFEEKIKSGKYACGFVLFPVEMSQVKKVADHQMTMPPKSTWVEPKLRSGLTIYNINE